MPDATTPPTHIENSDATGTEPSIRWLIRVSHPPPDRLTF